MKNKLRAAQHRVKTAFWALPLGHIVSFAIMGLCGLLTAYLFIASYETVFNVSVPFVDSVTTIDMRSLGRPLTGFSATNQSDVGNYGIPQTLILPSYSVRMTIAPAIMTNTKQANNHFLARANTAHIALTSSQNKGDVGNAVIYYRASWRTNDNPGQAQVGDNVFIDTDQGWRYFYRVSAVKVITTDDTYVAQANTASELIVVAADTNHNLLYVQEASLVSVQNISL